MHLKSFIVYFSIINLFLLPLSLQAQTKKSKNNGFNIRELALPSEVKDIGKSSGAIFYSPSVKGKALIPVNFWGEVTRGGLHFIPVDTDLIRGLSLAGGPKSSSKLTNIKVTRRERNKLKEYEFDISGGGTAKAYGHKLKPGDTVFVDKSRFFENRSYYTSLIGVAISILSAVLIYRQVRDIRKYQ